MLLFIPEEILLAVLAAPTLPLLISLILDL